MATINNGQSYLDGREVIKARDELQEELASLCEAVEDEYNGDDAKQAIDALREWINSDSFDELQALIKFCDGFEGHDRYASLTSEKAINDRIKQEFFDEYANNATFEALSGYLDMNAIVNDRLSDYSQADYDGVTYYYS